MNDIYINKILNLEKNIQLAINKKNIEYSLIQNYNLFNKNDSDDNNIATFIHNNYNSMDISMMRGIINKITTDQDIKKILLEYELNNLQLIEKKINITFEKFIIKMRNLLTKFQGKGGGYMIEDNEWILHTNENKIYLENTIDSLLINDIETNCFLDKITDLGNSICKNYKSYYNIIYNEDHKIGNIRIYIKKK